MTGEHAPGWQQSEDLPAAVMAALRRPAGEVVAIVATVDADGWPRTAAFGSLRPVTGRELGSAAAARTRPSPTSCATGV